VAAHRRRKKFLGVVPHGSVAPGTKETNEGTKVATKTTIKTNTAAPAADAPPPTAPVIIKQ
jgi:hypothetical protein